MEPVDAASELSLLEKLPPEERAAALSEVIDRLEEELRKTEQAPPTEPSQSGE